jgi:hypothetical protein
MAMVDAPRLASAEALDEWGALSDREREALLDLLEERVVIPRPLQLYVGEHSFDNAGDVAAIDACRGVEPAVWPYEHLVLLTTLWLWEESRIAVSELNQSDLSFGLLTEFFTAKFDRYAELSGQPGLPRPESLFALARALPRLREAVERAHVRCVRIDGATWERREWFLPKAEVPGDDVPAGLAAFLADHTGVRFPEAGDHRARFSAFTEALVAAGVNPAEAMVGLAEYGVRDERLDGDYAIVTCARGPHMDEPWRIELSDVLSYTAIRPGFDPKAQRIRLTDPQIRNAIAQRMRYNVVCRVRNYSPRREERMEAQAFQHPDLAVMEDGHHNGHKANGVRFVTRAPLVLELPVGGEVRTFKGLADFRLNRATHDDHRAFTPAELRVVIAYSWWLKAIFETAYGLGVELDPTYGSKLTFYEDRDGADLAGERARLAR